MLYIYILHYLNDPQHWELRYIPIMGNAGFIRLMDKILHDPKDPKLWELWYIPYNGQCRILSINRIINRITSKKGKSRHTVHLGLNGRV